jgi:hypothetical protein
MMKMMMRRRVRWKSLKSQKSQKEEEEEGG